MGLKELWILFLGGTGATDAGVEMLKSALPRCYILIAT